MGSMNNSTGGRANDTIHGSRYVMGQFKRNLVLVKSMACTRQIDMRLKDLQFMRKVKDR